jgi:membrane protein required for colicin V production
MNPPLQQTVGSPLWQLVFISFAVVLILFEIVRGWRLGLMRQIMRVIAIVAAYAAAYFGGQLLVPITRPLLRIPDVVLSILCGALLALIVYFVITSVGTIVFKRTRQQGSAIVRFFYGLTGAVIGLFFGAFLVWLVIVGVRSIGAVADAQVREQSSSGLTPSRNLHAIDVRRGILGESNEAPPSLMATLARLKNSLEMGAVGDVVKRTDAIPTRTYETLGKLGQVASSPENAERFLAFPGARELSEHPKIVALRNDPEIEELFTQGRFLDLLQDQRIIDALNDPTLLDLLRRFDLQRALDYSLSGKLK